MNTNLIPFLKKEAVVSIQIGSGYIEQLSLVLNDLVKDKTASDIAKIEKLVKAGKPLEPWMQSVNTINLLIEALYKEAEKQGFIEYREINSLDNSL